jgi:hypothetical protein
MLELMRAPKDEVIQNVVEKAKAGQGIITGKLVEENIKQITFCFEVGKAEGFSKSGGADNLVSQILPLSITLQINPERIMLNWCRILATKRV